MYISLIIYLLKKTRFIGEGDILLLIQSLITILICILKMFLVVNMVSIGTLIGLQQCYSIHKNQYIVCCNAFLSSHRLKVSEICTRIAILLVHTCSESLYSFFTLMNLDYQIAFSFLWLLLIGTLYNWMWALRKSWHFRKVLT